MNSSVIRFRKAGRCAGLLAVIVGVMPAFGAPSSSPWAADQAKPAKDTVVITHLDRKSFLGVGVQEIDAERAREKKLSEQRGVEITSVQEGSPADNAGLQKGDVVLEYNGQRVEGVEQFVRLVRETPVGRQVTMSVSRDGAIETLTATIGPWEKWAHVFKKGDERRIHLPDIDIPRIRIPDIPQIFTAWRTARLGIEAESLKSQLADYFGVKEGVLVRSVVKGSVAEKAGLRAGDVVVKVGDIKVATPREISSAIREMESETFPVTIMREKREMSLTVTMDADPGGEGSLRQRIVFEPGTEL